MFYVSVSKDAMSKVMDHVKSVPDKDVIGLLIGRMDDQTLIVDAAVSGEMIRDKKNVVMPGETLASIADDIVNKKVKGNIIGWYHSHPGYGVFMSDIDKQTQSKLLQFSPYIVALVSDPSTGEFKFYSYDEKSKATQTLADDQVHFFGDEELPVPEGFKKAALPTPPPKVSPSAPSVPMWPKPPASVAPVPRQPLAKRQIYALVLMVIIAGAIVTGALITNLYGGGPIKIDHKPVTSALVGNDIQLLANVTGGGVKSVVIYHKLSMDSVWKNDNMLETSGNTYSYTIQGSDVTGNLDYYIVASDTSGNKIATPTTTIIIGNFEIEASDSQLIIYVGQAKTTTVTVRSVNAFSSPIYLDVPDRPTGIANVSFSPQQITPSRDGEATSTMTVTVDPSAGAGEFKMEIQAKYGQVLRSRSILIIVSGFDVSVLPSSLTVQRGSTAKYTVILEIKKGFTDVVSVDVTGLPSKGIDQTRITVVNKKIAAQGITTLTMEIVTKFDVPLGTYSLKIVVTGGGITQEEGATLIIQ